MATRSLTSIALLFMVDVLSLSNYLFIRKLRSVVDDRSFQNENTFFNAFSKKFSTNPLVAGFKGFGRGFHQARKEENMSETEKKKGTSMEVLYAVMLGRHRMAPSVDKRFPGWKPIPFKIGIWSTAITILAITFLLSENSLTNKLAVATGGEGGFCATEDADQKLALFQLHIKSSNVTNIDQGRDQYNATRTYRDQLLRDTARYIDCPEEPNNEKIKGGNNINTKVKYSKNEEVVTRYGERFFPGYWRALLQKKREKGCSVRKKICWDSWGLSIICKRKTIPTPCSPSWQGKIDEDLQADEVAFESDASVDNLDHLKQESAEMIQRLMKQFDVAGTMYSIYMVVALFFPTPMVLYRPSIVNTMKTLLFGVRKFTFIITVLVIYWVSDYATMILNQPEINIFLGNIRSDPCFLDADFIRGRSEIVSNTCNDLINIENKLGVAKFEISQLIEDITQFDKKCDCPFPANSQDYSNLTIHNYGFEKDWDIRTKPYVTTGAEQKAVKSSLWKAKEDFAFLGNETICVDRLYAQKKIMVADDTGLSWWQIWISSGIFASLVIKFFIANFGISLVKLADPFYVHDGKYESPPNDVNISEEEGDAKSFLFVNEAISQNKIAALKAIALREVIIWGALTNFCLISLFIASIPDMKENAFNTLDKVITSFIILICIIGPIGCFYLSRYVNKVVEESMESEKVKCGTPDTVTSIKTTVSYFAPNTQITATNPSETKLSKLGYALTPLRKKKDDTITGIVSDATSKVMASISTPAKKNDNTMRDKFQNALTPVLKKKKDETMLEKINDSITGIVSDATSKVMASISTPAKKNANTMKDKFQNALTPVLKKKKDETMLEKINDSATKVISAFTCM
ncbi:hypothetical protein CTEN210_06619 [Chaetoceros tenuissimus]|uniref:Uncharacterized protein n=1 Tax=Chaetoceros tenuissimus TaxID=426638 RepID=A0AAD3CQQ1_9STRA|nr:hypothetical protein CTEN210_06619 [Chaetoceros tenuissimus]